jgi:hypothetical protein
MTLTVGSLRFVSVRIATGSSRARLGLCGLFWFDDRSQDHRPAGTVKKQSYQCSFPFCKQRRK